MNKKQTFYLLPALLWILFTAIAVLPSTALAKESGTCGDENSDITWEFEENGTLTFHGSGKMPDYKFNYKTGSTSPWAEAGLTEQIKNVVIEEGITSLGAYAFDGCENMETVSLPDSLESMGEWTFYDCEALKEITIPEKLTALSDYAFYDCKSLTSVNLPETLKSMGHYAFSFCTSLSSLTIPDGVTDLGDNCFSHCIELTTVNLPSGITKISEGLFDSCIKLSSITEIPEGITTIKSRAFSSCYSLTSLKLPSTLTDLGSGVFSYCTKLKEFSVSEESTSFSVEDGILYSYDKTTIFAYPVARSDTSFRVPDGVETIADYCFCKAGYLKEITFPATLKEILSEAFFNCTKLQTATFEDIDNCQLETIDYGAFEKCSALTGLTLPNRVKTINSRAFEKCSSLSADTVNIPSSLTFLGSGVFTDTPVLTDLEPVDGLKILDHWILDVSKEDFPEDTILTIPDGTIGMANLVLTGTSTLSRISLPASLLYIGTDQFTASSYSTCILSDIEVAEDNPNFTSLDGNLYNKEMTTLLVYAPGKTDEEFTVPDGVTLINDSAFYCASSLTSIHFPASLERIGFLAFYNSGLIKDKENEVVIFDGWLLSADTEEEEFTLPDGLIGISDSAFFACSNTSTTSLILPSSLRYIGSDTFMYFLKVSDIYYKGTEEEWKKNVTLYSLNSIPNRITLHYGTPPMPSGTPVPSVSPAPSGSPAASTAPSPGNSSVVTPASPAMPAITAVPADSGKDAVSAVGKKPKGTTLKKIVRKKKALSIKWKKQPKGTNGYQLQYSLKKKFKKAKSKTIKKTKTTSCTLRRLKTKKQYYVRIRTYRRIVVNGKKQIVYSSWSKVKKAKTK